MFFDKKCTLYTVTDTNVDGVQERLKDFVAIYDCDFYEMKGGYMQGGSMETLKDAYEVCINGAVQAKQGMYILLTDPLLGDVGEYLIDTVMIYRLGAINNTVLTTTRKGL